ncbi:MAG: ASCH domain-containing protein [Nanoarchaeota archaeon]|nr:ASCH domain-containing protein [Nanoarchaeota archaeon]
MQATVLSLKQPWAELVASGKKSIELRSWNTKHRGLFYIHASNNIDKEKCSELRMNINELVTGAIIAKAELLTVKKYDTKKELLKDSKKHYAEDYKTPCHGFLLNNIKRIKPVYCKGRLGFWKIII